MNYQTPYLTEESLHTLCSYFDVALVQLRVITKTKKKFVEIVTERYLIITYLIQNKKSKKQLFRIYLPVKLVDGRMSIKKEEVSSYPCSYITYKIFILIIDGWKN